MENKNNMNDEMTDAQKMLSIMQALGEQQNIKTKAETSNFTFMIHEMYSGFMDQGFTSKQAMDLTKQFMSSALVGILKPR